MICCVWSGAERRDGRGGHRLAPGAVALLVTGRSRQPGADVQAEVAAAFDSFVPFDQDGTDQADDGVAIGENAAANLLALPAVAGWLVLNVVGCRGRLTITLLHYAR